MEGEPRFFKTVLWAFPLGLIVLGALSFVFYFDRPVEAETGSGDEIAKMLRKDVTKADLERHVRVLSEKIGARSSKHPKNLKATVSYLESTLGMMNMGYAVQRQEYEVGGEVYVNVFVELKGREKPDEVVVVGAHYDSAFDVPGADDNATGVAALLSLAHAMTGTEVKRTVRFVAFANEEPPFFKTDGMGSLVYARKCKADGEKVVGMLCLESLGYYSDKEGSQKYPAGLSGMAGLPTKGNFIGVVGNQTSARLVQSVGKAMGGGEVPVVAKALPGLVPWIGNSDHWSFWENGFAAVMITDTAPFRNPHYHEMSDLPKTLDFERMFAVVKQVEKAVKAVANE